MERLRVGVATSMLISAWAEKKDGGQWGPGDVFPDLRPPEPDADESAQGILQMFRLMQASQKVH